MNPTGPIGKASAIAAVVLSAAAVWAQDEGDDAAGARSSELPETQAEPAAVPVDETDEAAGADADAGEAEQVGSASALRPEDDLIAEAELGNSPIERPGVTYHFVGLRYRGIIVPKFMMNLFGDGGSTVYVNSVGPEFGLRKDEFEYSFGLWWAGYYMDKTLFKASSDPALAWEMVESKLNAVYLTVDFLWSQQFSPEFGLNYGVGAGFGFVFGSLIREQAYPTAGVNDLDAYEVCVGPNNPPGAFCGMDNDHYAGYEEPSWADGGSKPIVFPWLAVQTGLRYKPHKNFVMRLDAGFGVSGFFLGLGADYGL